MNEIKFLSQFGRHHKTSYKKNSLSLNKIFREWRSPNLPTLIVGISTASGIIYFTGITSYKTELSELKFQEAIPSTIKGPEMRFPRHEVVVLKKTLVEVPKLPILIEGYSDVILQDFISTTLSTRPATIQINLGQFKDKPGNVLEILLDLSARLGVKSVYFYIKLLQLIYGDVTDEATIRNILESILNTATKALNAIKVRDGGHHPPVIYVEGLSELLMNTSDNNTNTNIINNNVNDYNSSVSLIATELYVWCQEVCTQRSLAHVVLSRNTSVHRHQEQNQELNKKNSALLPHVSFPLEILSAVETSQWLASRLNICSLTNANDTDSSSSSSYASTASATATAAFISDISEIFACDEDLLIELCDCIRALSGTPPPVTLPIPGTTTMNTTSLSVSSPTSSPMTYNNNLFVTLREKLLMQAQTQTVFLHHHHTDNDSYSDSEDKDANLRKVTRNGDEGDQSQSSSQHYRYHHQEQQQDKQHLHMLSCALQEVVDRRWRRALRLVNTLCNSNDSSDSESSTDFITRDLLSPTQAYNGSNINQVHNHAHDLDGVSELIVTVASTVTAAAAAASLSSTNKDMILNALRRLACAGHVDRAVFLRECLFGNEIILTWLLQSTDILRTRHMTSASTMSNLNGKTKNTSSLHSHPITTTDIADTTTTEEEDMVIVEFSSPVLRRAIQTLLLCVDGALTHTHLPLCIIAPSSPVPVPLPPSITPEDDCETEEEAVDVLTTRPTMGEALIIPSSLIPSVSLESTDMNINSSEGQPQGPINQGYHGVRQSQSHNANTMLSTLSPPPLPSRSPSLQYLRMPLAWANGSVPPLSAVAAENTPKTQSQSQSQFQSVLKLLPSSPSPSPLASMNNTTSSSSAAAAADKMRREIDDSLACIRVIGQHQSSLDAKDVREVLASFGILTSQSMVEEALRSAPPASIWTTTPPQQQQLQPEELSNCKE